LLFDDESRTNEECSTRAQFLCLGAYLRDEPVARRAHQTWAALSRASHFHDSWLKPHDVVLQLRTPQLDTTARIGALLSFFRRGSIHLPDGRPGMLVEELSGLPCRRHKRARQLRVWSATDDHE
jgi:hypothetical protein